MRGAKAQDAGYTGAAVTPDSPALPHPAAEPGWDGEAQFAYLARQTAAQVRVVQATYGFALARRHQGAHAEACRLLASGALLVARFAPDMRDQVDRALAVSAWVDTPAAVQALRPFGLRLASLKLLATAAWAAHALLPTRRLRLRLKARVLRLACDELSRAAAAGAARAQRHPRGNWNVEALCVDAATLRREALDVLRAVLVPVEGRGAESLALHAAT